MSMTLQEKQCICQLQARVAVLEEAAMLRTTQGAQQNSDSQTPDSKNLESKDAKPSKKTTPK